MRPAPLGLRSSISSLAIGEEACVAFALHSLRDPLLAGPLWGCVSNTGRVLINVPGSLRQPGKESGLINEAAVRQGLCAIV